MSSWNNIIETFHALPEADRTSDKVHVKLLEQGHVIGRDDVRDVLCAAVLGEMLNRNDVRVTARTMKLLLDICATSLFWETRVSRRHTDHAWHVAGPLSSIIGRDGRDLTHVLARLFAGYDETVEIARLIDYYEEMDGN
jgi:hypothetical protein